MLKIKANKFHIDIDGCLVIPTGELVSISTGSYDADETQKLIVGMGTVKLINYLSKQVNEYTLGAVGANLVRDALKIVEKNSH